MNNINIFDFKNLLINNNKFDNDKNFVIIDFIEIIYNNLNIYYPLPFLKYTNFIHNYCDEILINFDENLFQKSNKDDQIIKVIIFLKIKIIFKFANIFKNIDLVNLNNLLDTNNYCEIYNQSSDTNLDINEEINYWSNFYSNKIELTSDFKIFLETYSTDRFNLNFNINEKLTKIIYELYRKPLSVNISFLFLILYKHEKFKTDIEKFIINIITSNKKNLTTYNYIFKYKSFLIKKSNNKFRILNINYDVGHFLNYIILAFTKMFLKHPNKLFQSIIPNLLSNYSEYKWNLKRFHNKNIFKIDLKKAFDNLPFDIIKYYTFKHFQDYLFTMIQTPITLLNGTKTSIIKNKGIQIGNILSFHLYDFYLYNYLIYLFKDLLIYKIIHIYYHVDDIRFIDVQNKFNLEEIINIFNKNNLFINKQKTELLIEDKFYLCVGKLEIKFSTQTINTNINLIFNKKILEFIDKLEDDPELINNLKMFTSNFISKLSANYKKIALLYYIFQSQFKNFNYQKFIENLQYLSTYKKIILNYNNNNNINITILKIYENYFEYLYNKFDIYIINSKLVLVDINTSNINELITKTLNKNLFCKTQICNLINNCSICKYL